MTDEVASYISYPSAEIYKELHVVRLAKVLATIFENEIRLPERMSKLGVTKKEDGSPVTRIDTYFQDLLSQALRQYYPNAEIHGEEDGLEATVQTATSRIDIDPLDATTALGEWVKSDSTTRRKGNLPDCNILVGERPIDGSLGFGCVVRLAQRKIYYSHGDGQPPVVIDIKTGKSTTMTQDLLGGREQQSFFVRAPRHNRWDKNGELRRQALFAQIKSVFPNLAISTEEVTEPSAVNCNVNEAGNIIDFLRGKYDGVIILPMTGHDHDLVGPINIARAMPGVVCANVITHDDAPGGISADYCAHGFVAARDQATLEKLLSTVKGLYPAIYGTPANDPYTEEQSTTVAS